MARVLRNARGQTPFVAAFALLLLCNQAFAAGPYDPEVDYITLTTPRFHVVAPVGYEHIALRSARIAENVYPGMIERYGYEPDGRVTIIINDQTDFANGSATILPNKVVTIFVTAPTEVSGLEDYDDWLQMVIIHELSHIFHLDMVFGLPWVGRLLFGKYVAMNQYIASWATEGLATYEETIASSAGRGRSSLVEMHIRMASLEDTFPTIDRAYRSHRFWPFGNIVYFYGGRFQLWLAENFGEEALMHYHRAYAASPIPYLTWLSSWIAFDYTLETLWGEFKDQMLEDAQHTLRMVETSSIPMTEPKRLTFYGGQVLGPRVTPDGKHIVFSTSSPVDGPRVRRMKIDGSDQEVLLNDTLSKAIAFSPKGDAFYFQQTEINQRFYSHNSILRYDIAKKYARRVMVDQDQKIDYLAPSGSLRARDPDVSKDGKRIVFVQTPYGANRLVLGWLESNGYTVHAKVIVPAEPDVQLSNPRFSPDGQSIAVSRFANGRRDIWIYDVHGKVKRRVTRDRAQDVDPTWSSDGRWLVFSSDRTGIYNLYAYDVRKDELRQLTNVISGAFQPCVSPDQKMIVFRGYVSEGFDVYTVPFAPEDAAFVELDRMPPLAGRDTRPRRKPPLQAAAVEPPSPAPFTGTPLPDELPEGWSFDDYSALDTLLPFHDNWNLLPLVAANERELFAQLTHIGGDALGTHSYAAWLTYWAESRFLGGGAVYVNDQLLPTFSIGAEVNTRSVRIFDRTDPSFPFIEFFNEKRAIGSIGVAVPMLQRHRLSMSYTFERRTALREPSAFALERGTRLPALGNFARVQLGYSYGNVRSFPYSISTERGWSANIALDGLSKGLGSDVEQILISGEARGYISLPFTQRWLQNHVIAMRLALGIGAGPDVGDAFRLGGSAGSSVLTTTTQNFYPLRGLLSGGLFDTGTLNGSVEYRAPIWRVERGLWTVPFTFRVLHAAVFSDFGRVFDQLSGDLFTDRPLDAFNVSVGAELRANVLFGWATGLQLRLGYAYLLHTPVPALDASGLYFQIGSTF